MTPVRRVRPKAVDDMEAIAYRIGEDNPAAADRWLATLDELLNRLAEFPRLAPCSSINSHWRVMPFGSYLLVYREIEHGVDLLRIVHGSRDLETALEP